MNFLTPDTNIALLQASQNHTAKALNEIKPGNLEKTTKNGSTQAEIDAAAQDFEAVFIAEMLKPMFEGTTPEAPFGGGKGEEVFQSFLLQEYGKIVAQTGSIGVADHVRTELLNIQEKANNALNQ